MAPHRLLAAGLPLVAVLAGCGGSGMMHGGTTSAGSGRALFVADCGSCHALAAAGTGGAVGPDLDRTRPAYGRVVRFVTDGGSTMPAFSGMLTRAQIGAIARYVADAAGSGR
jgi:mono/diheme cytochrome c family protein